MLIYYGVCGEGLGHIGRSIAIINELINLGHEVHIFTFGQAFDYLKGAEDVYKVPGLQLAFINNKADIKGTLKNYLKFRRKISSAIKEIVNNHPRPDLCITDFEPIIPRVAIAHDIFCISIDNQHKFTLSPKGLPLRLKVYSYLAGKFINWFIPETYNIITTFHECENCTNLVDVIVRKEIAEIIPHKESFILVYLKDCLENKILDVLKEISEETFVVYGSTKVSCEGNLIFKGTSNEGFARDLANCKRVICTAGNQLIGEAKFFRKPVFAIPLANQTEQMINAWYVEREGLGTYCDIRDLTSVKVREFMKTEYNIPLVLNGLEQVMEFLDSYL